MDVESLAKQLILKGMTEEQQSAVLESIKSTMLQARAVQKQRVGENVQVVVQALKKLEADIKARYDETGKAIEKRVASIKDGKDGQNGINGKDGRDGRPGRDGATGPRGNDGMPGRNGIDGVDGVSVTNAFIDFDGSLIINLSNGQDLNVGEVVAPDLAEKIKVITNGGGTSQQVLDTLASLQSQINDLIPSQTGNAGKFLTTNGSVLSWGSAVGGLSYEGTWDASTNTPTLTSGTGTNGYYYVVSTAGSTNLDGITDWKIGDWLIFNGTDWQKIDQSWAIAGVNDNITSMTGLTGGISSPDFIQFDTAAVVTDATGRLYYNDDDQFQTLAFQMNGSVIQHVGHEIFYRVRLSAAATKGQVLMFTGTLGASGGLTAAPATGLTFDQSNYLLGIAGESGATNDWITVYEFGEVTGVNTSAFTQGQILYYDPTVTGGLTATKPNTPNAISTIAAVVHVGTSNGVLFVRPTFGSALGGTDGNVRFGTLASGNTIIYDAVDGVWKNANLTDGTGITITEGAGSITITNSAPDQTVSLTGAGTTSISGTYPNFTITSADSTVGTVTSVGGTGTVSGISLSGTVTSSGNLTLGGTLDLSSPPTIGNTAANTGTFTTLTANGNTTLGDASADTVTINGTVQPGVVISGSSTGDALRITQTGTGNALLVEDSANPDSTPLVVDQNSFLVAGHTAAVITGLTSAGRVATANNTASTGQGVQITKYRASASLGADLEFAKSGSTTMGENAIVATGHVIGNLWFNAADGTGYPTAAQISAAVDGTPGTNDMPGRLVFSTTADGASSPTERVRIDSAGNVGIGTSTPAVRLVGTNLSVNGASQASIELLNAGASSGELFTNSNGTTLAEYRSLPLLFRTNGVNERMRIDSSGNVGIGTTSPAQKLDVSGIVQATRFSGTNGSTALVNTGAGDNRPLFIQNSNAGGLPNGSLYIDNTNNPNNTTFSFINSVAGGVQKFVVYGNGTTQNGTGVYGTISDSRIKKDIVDTSPKLDKLLQVRVVNYTRTDDPTESRQLGVIAQELEEVFPGLVDVVAEKDVDGNVTCPDRKSVKYSIFVPMLIKAVQEQQAIIAQLQADVETLKAQNPVQPDPNAG